MMIPFSGGRLLHSLLQSITDRSRKLLGGTVSRSPTERSQDLLELCEQLISGRGEASGVALASDILARYQSLDCSERLAFYQSLAAKYGPDHKRLNKAAAGFISDPNPASEAELHKASEPRRQELVRRLNLAPEGTKVLVEMRAHLLGQIEGHPELAAVDHDFFHLFSSWFNRGFLLMQRIDWSSPAAILEKIIRYEAVHEIQGWNDLRARIDLPDRRCYAFFHPALTDEPLIFVEVALTKDVPSAIHPILEQDRQLIDPQQATTAVFYSISNTQRGLAGVSFGSFLIKQVAEDITREFPRLKTFVTLSPAPGFRRWLDNARKKGELTWLSDADHAALKIIDMREWHLDRKNVSSIEPLLSSLAAYYFLKAKGKRTKPLDPVARFHLGNGAKLHRINLMADLSPRGLAQSAGVMVNYRYELKEIEANHEVFANKGWVIASEEVHKLLQYASRKRENAPMSKSQTNHLFDALQRGIPSCDSPMIHLPSGGIITYGEMFALSSRISAYLRKLHVQPGDRMAVQVEKSWQNLALYIACIRAGAVFLPLNTAYSLAELEYFLSDAEAFLIVCRPENETEVRDLASTLKITKVETLGTEGQGSLIANSKGLVDTSPASRAADDLAAILYTSGTTGRSKGAMLTHENLLSNAQVLKDYWRFSAADVLLHALPIYHTHGLFVATNVTLLAGSSIVLLPKFDAGELLRLMPIATCMMGVPTFYARLADNPKFTRQATAHMRLFVSGSAPLLSETHSAFQERTGHSILERYGMTETNMITSNPYDGARVMGSVGMPLSGIEVRIVDAETGRVLSPGEVGVIEVKGPNVFKGYWRQPKKTAAEFRSDGFFMTGDVGRIDESGYVYIVGRAKDLVISGGLNVYPKEVETEIDAIAGVSESAVIGVPHADLGEGVTAIVVRSPNSWVSENDILKALTGRLARFKQPKRIIFVETLPRNAMGKVQKNILRENYSTLYGSEYQPVIKQRC